MSTNIINLTAQNIQTDLLDPSAQTLFVIDFWADWCEPCKQLMPVLDKIAAEYQGKLILAKVNCDEQQQLAQQFGIKSLPTVMLFKDGQPIDGFAGVQPESEIKAMIDKHLPRLQDDYFMQAYEAHQTGDKNQAFTLIKQALEIEPENADYKILLADICVDIGRMDETKEILANVKLVDQNAQYQHVLAKYELAEQAADSPEIQNLHAQLADAPDSMSVKRQLAIALNQVKRNEEALELLLSILKKDMAFEDSKKLFLDIISSLPDGDVLTSKYRRQLYTLLY